jgi:holo-[acyl-carrier protein] synthase
MNIIAHGIDMVSISRIEMMISKHGEHFLERVYTDCEIAYAGGGKKRFERLAGRFAAKEAVFKLIGTGLRGKMKWTDIEVLSDGLGKPLVELTGEAAFAVAKRGIERITVSITHTSGFAMASAVAVADI